MTANVVPFPKGSGTAARLPELQAGWRRAPSTPPPLQQSEALRDARRKLAECWELRAESRRIQRDYEERQRAIERLLAGIPADAERA